MSQEKHRLAVRPHPLSPLGLRQENNRLRTENEKLKSENKALSENTVHDPLTGLYNRRFLDEQLPAICTNFESITVFFFDVDNFKEFNSKYGHPGGDRILIRLAHTLQDNLKTTDYVVRYGGDEDVAVIPNVNNNQITQIAFRLQEAFLKQGLNITFGFATMNRESSNWGPEILSKTIEIANQEMLRMKQFKNQAEI